MIARIFHIIKPLPFFFLILANTVFAQTQNHQLDSTENSFKAASGQKKIELIADFIRNANFHIIDHYRFKPYLEEAFEWEKQHTNIKLLNTLNLGYANILIAENNSTESIRCLHEIIESKEHLTQKDSISIYEFLFNLYSNIGAYSEAWGALQTRDNVIEQVSDTNPMYLKYNKLRISGYPLLLLKTKQYKKSILAIKKQITYGNKLKDLHLEAGSLNNLGLVYLKVNKPDSAIWAFNESKRIWRRFVANKLNNESPGDMSFIDLLDGNIGNALNLKGEYKKAIPLIIRELEAFQKNEDYLALIGPLNKLSVSYMGLKQYDKAISILDSAGQISEVENFPNKLRRIYELKIQALEGLGNVNEALQLYKKLTVFNDSMLKVGDNERLAVLEVVYEVKNKEIELNNQKNKVIKAEENVAQQKANQQSLIVGVVLMLAIIVLLIVNSLQRKKRVRKLAEGNKLIEHQKEVIEQSLVEKETLLKEIHHRVKNNLQLISGILELQAVQFEDGNVREMMAESQSRVRSMALIHQQLYQSNDLGKIDFREYLNKLTNDIAIAYNDPEKEIKFLIKVEQFSVDINTAVPLGLIVNELIANAYKHAFKGRKKGCITIDLIPVKKEKIQLRIIDDGIGLPKDFNPKSKKSLGLRLVQGLIRQLDGEYYFESKNGTQFVLEFQNKIFK